MTILVPHGAEAAAVRRANGNVRVVEIAAGAAAARTLPADLDDPVVVMGLCGALRDHAVGDVVIYRSVRDGTGVTALDVDVAAALGARFPQAIAVDACSTDHVVTTIAERVDLATHQDADVVDMEGTHLAAALAARGLRFAMLRVVSDDASRDLPALAGAIRAGGTLDVPRIALAFVRRPHGALAFVRDVRTALAALTAAARRLTP